MPPAGSENEIALAEARAQRSASDVAARLIDAPHAARVALHLAVLEQLGDGALHGLIALAIDGHAQRGEPLDEAARGATTKPRRSPGARILESVPM